MSRNLHRLRHLALAAAIVLSLDAGTGHADLGQDIQAIVNGTPTTGDSGVVGIVLRDDHFLFCTGTLIAPRIVVTAAHCVERFRADEIEIFVGPVPGEGTYTEVLHVRSHPQYSPYTYINDIAALLLASPLDDSVWPPLPPTANRDLLRLPARVVGYGITNLGAPRRAGPKREGLTVISGVDDLRLSLSSNPATMCYGDSGGPAFVTIDGVEYFAGIALQGDCLSQAISSRVDIHVEDFLQPFEEQVTEGAATIGDRCFFPEHCSSGLQCSPDGDGTGPDICTQSCATASDCAAGMECLPDASGARRCAWPTPQPGALEGACAFDSDCTQGFCDTAGLLVRGKCRLAANSGCAVSRPPGPFAGCVPLAVVLFLLAGRRRRRARR